MGKVWRLHLRSAAMEGVDPSKFCVKRHILGVGWPVCQKETLDWDTYCILGEKEYGDKGWRAALRAVGKRMAVDDLCWSRDQDGNYYIGKIEGHWEYRFTPEYRNADIVNIRPCTWFRIGGVDSVPGKVLNNFRAPGTVQRIYDETAALYSKWKYNQLSGTAHYTLPGIDKPNLFSLISTEDCEDIVGIYLQETHGYRLIPSTCKLDTLKTEFVLRKATGKAHVQVKQGNIVLDRDDYRDNDPCDLCDWFLFTTCGRYTGRIYGHVHCLCPEEMRDFATNNRHLMSKRVQGFISFLGL